MTWHMYQDMGMCGCLKFVGLTALWKAIRGSYGLVEGRKGSSHFSLGPHLEWAGGTGGLKVGGGGPIVGARG